MKIRIAAKRFVLGAIVTALMVQIAIIPAQYSFAVSGLSDTDYVANIANVMRMMNDAAKMQLLTQKMQSCLSDGNRGRLPYDFWGNPENDKIWNEGMIWKNDWMLNDTAIGAGYYLEAIANSNKTQDGKMFCGEGADGSWSNGLFHTFVNTLKAEGVVSGDAAWQQVICNKDDPSRYGILARRDGAACDTGAKQGGGTAYFARYEPSASHAYLGELYNAWVANYKDDNGNVVGNKYAVPYASIADYGGTANRQVGATAYFLWSREISVFCAGVNPSATTKFNIGSLEARSGDPQFDTELVWIGTEAEDGAAASEVKIKATGKGGSGGTQGASFGANVRNCNELIAAANAAVANVQEEYRAILSDLCRQEITAQIASARATLAERYPNGEEYSETDAAAAAELEAFEAQTGADKYIVDEGNSTAPAPNDKGGWQCVDSDQLTFLTTIEQGEYGNDEENNTSGGTNGEETVDCFTGGGALGWILCPVLEGAAKAVDWAYESIIEPFLNIDSRLFSNDGSGDGTAVFNAWSIFQGFANIAFIILLLVVIFSQLTGVGIDNYGVKKILPKLIITAVLINLSYIICQLAVDLSNVLGFSLRALFEGIASGVTVPAGTFAPDMNLGATFLTGVVAALVGALGVMAIVTQGLAIILPMIVGIISALIAVFFLFVLLGVRQAGVVLLVVISPLAFVCYMLPNTKKLFDRWQKMFMGLLLFFPICGLLIGAGELASKILLSTGTESFFMALTAMLINVVPFFFLPMLLKASFAAMGNIGAKISGFGQNINKRAQGAGRSALDRSRFGQWAQRGKNYREYQRGEASKVRQSQFQRGKAQGVIDRYGGRNMADLSAQERARLSSARQTISAHDSQQTKMFADSFSNMGTGGEVANGLRQALDSGDDNMAAAAIDDLAARGDFDVLSSTLAQYDPSKFTPAMRDRLSNSLITHKKDAAHLWGWSKQMKSGNTMSLEEYASGRVAQRGADGRIVRDSAGRAQFTSNALQDASGNSISMRKDLEKENDDLMSTQDKTSLEAINSLTGGNGSAAFSDKQMINAAGNLDKASSQKQFNEMLMGSGRTQEIMHQMSAAQIAKIKGSTLEAIAKQSGYVPVLNAQTGKEDYSGFDLSGHVSADALKQLSDPQNASILAGMNEDVRKSLRIPATSPTPPPTPPPPPPSS